MTRGIVLALLVAAGNARAELIDIAWDSAGHFEKTVSVSPGKFAEVCGKLSKGEAIAWSFRSDHPMNFNVHFHEGKGPADRQAGSGLLLDVVQQDRKGSRSQFHPA